VCEKLEKQSFLPFWDRPKILLVRHSLSNSEALRLLSHGMAVNLEHHLLPQFRLSRNLWSCEPILLSIAHSLRDAEWYLT
jgi:hypothetical protein